MLKRVGRRSKLDKQLLLQHHCDLVQGYYFSRPLTEQQLPAFLALLPQGWPAALLKQPA